ncbi:MAG: T9SS type A sorting domain-containing protein [Candidatus Neomarinimicrobiota bacterium]
MQIRAMLMSRIYTPIILLATTISICSSLGAAQKNGAQSGGRLNKLLLRDSGNFDGNRINYDLDNNGMIVSHRISGHSGMEWPKGSGLYIDFASGIWIAGMVGSDIHTAVSQFASEMVPGPWGSEIGDPVHHLFKVNKSDLADPLASDDFQNWPVDFGAPWVDEDGDGVYSPMPLGLDHPEFMGDQVIWYVMNDGDVDAHGAVFNTLPLGIEVQMTIWGYNRPDAFGDMMFVKALIINKGGNNIVDTYIGLWNDPDLGDASDDFVGCDTTLDLGFVYNDGADANYGVRAPALGFDFFQGPLVASPGDTGFAFGRSQPGYRNLSMTSFGKYISTSDPAWSGPETAREAYNLMQGLRKDGVAYRGPDGTVTKFIHAGDPVTEEGWIDKDTHASDDRRYLMNAGPFTMADGDSQEVVYGIIIARGSDHLTSITLLKQADVQAQLAYDQQFAKPTAPRAPVVTYSTQAAEINLMWDTAQESYVSLDLVDIKPDSTSTEVTEWMAYATFTDSMIYGYSIYDTLTSVYDPDSAYATPIIILGVVIDTTYTMTEVVVAEKMEYTFELTSYEFEGYNIYQYDNATGSGRRKRIATFDRANGVTQILDVVFDTTHGVKVLIPVQHGDDTGLRHHLTLSNDPLGNGIPFKTNRVYYFAVTAYGYNEFGVPKTLESKPEIIAIRPAISVDTEVTAEGGEVFDDIAHPTGMSHGEVEVIVVDPVKVTGHDYEVSFANQEYYLDTDGSWQPGPPPSTKGLGKVLVYQTSTITVWNVKDLTTNADVAILQRITDGKDYLTGETYVDGSDGGWTFFDGIKIRVSGERPHTLASEGWSEVGGAISPLFATVEEYTDANGDGLYTYAEAFEDVGVDAQVDQLEPGYIAADHVLVDIDPSGDDYDATNNPLGAEGNGVYNPWPYPEAFTDTDADGVWDIGEAFLDLGTDSLASIDEEGYLEPNVDPGGDNYDSTSAPLGTEGNLLYDVGEPFTDTNDDGSWTDAEPYVDANGNGRFDSAYDTTGTWPDIVDSYVFYTWYPGSPIGGSDYPEVEVRFVEMQSYTDVDGNGQWDKEEPYVYDTTDANASYADMYETWGAGHFSGFNRVPYSAWNMDTDPPTQLHVVQLDRTANGAYDPGESGTWNYIWITNVEYDGTSKFNDDNDFMALMGDALAPGLYGLWLSTEDPAYGPAFARAGTYTFTPARDNQVGDVFVFSTKGATAKAIDMDIVNVWPNPYFAYNPEERTPVARMMQFTHLPPEATIRIFNLAGELVKKIEHDDGTQYETWDLTNNFNNSVASGMYIASIESEYGSKVLKLAVIQAE